MKMERGGCVEEDNTTQSTYRLRERKKRGMERGKVGKEELKRQENTNKREERSKNGDKKKRREVK